MSKYFKLAPGHQVFWDPTQSETANQKLVGDQIKPLSLTKAVIEAKRNERIVAVDEKEAKAYCKEKGIDFVSADDESPEEAGEDGKPAAKKTGAKN